MKTSKRVFGLATLGFLTLFIFAPTASGDIVVYMTDDGTDLTLSYSGTIDTSSFSAPSGFGIGNYFVPTSPPSIRFVPAAGASVDGYTFSELNDPFGTGGGSISGFGFTGDVFGFSNSRLYLPVGFVSGALSGSIVYTGTVASYELFETTVYNLGATGQTITLTTVPEPSSLAFLLTFGIAIGYRRKRTMCSDRSRE